MKKNGPVTLIHDAVVYSWDQVSQEKYDNWVRMKHTKFDTQSFKASAYPYQIQVEPTNTCNLKCACCPVGMGEIKRPAKHMEPELFKSLVDDMERWLMYMILWDYGEPLMHPQLPEMVEYAASKDIRTAISTNAHFLNKNDYVEALFKAGLSTLIVAIDSLDGDGYEIYRREGKLSAALSGLNNAIEMKRCLGVGPLINLRMVLMKHNEHEMSDMRSLAKELGVDLFSVKTLNPTTGHTSKDEELLPKRSSHRRYKYIPGTFERVRSNHPCNRVWKMTNIFSNGEVAPCNNDHNGQLRLGNIHETPLSEIWNSPEYCKLRKRLYNMEKPIEECTECPENWAKASRSWFVEPKYPELSKLPDVLRSYFGRKARFRKMQTADVV